MAQFFQISTQNHERASQFTQKRKCFQKQIRNKDRCEKLRQMRAIGNEAPHIQAIVNALPHSWLELVEYMIANPQYEEAVSKTILNKIYPLQLSESLQSQFNQDQTYHLLPQNSPSSKSQFSKVIYLFSVMLEFQGTYAAVILKRYFAILLEEARQFDAFQLLFGLFTLLVHRPQLNWVPLKEMQSTLMAIQQAQKKLQNPCCIYSSEIDTYYYLSIHYQNVVSETEEIRNRVKFILEKGSECFQIVKPKIFFKLCLNLTYQESLYENNQHKEIQQNMTQSNLFFHNAMIKGQIIKSLYRQIFFSSKEKLRLLCLQILRNLILEFGSSFFWAQQKLSPIQNFQQGIKDDSISMRLYMVYCQVFLISILYLPIGQLTNVIENQVDALELILYILENSRNDLSRANSINQLANQSLWYLIQNGGDQVRKTVATTLIQSRWKNLLISNLQLIDESHNILNIHE